MEKNFWKDLPKPFFALAPLANVTDAAFRRIIAKYGKPSSPRQDGSSWRGGPDVFFTEFVSADGLVSAGRSVLLKDLEYSEREHPIVAQLFTSHSEKMKEASVLVASLGFDGIDINMGCPDRTVEKQGAGAALIKSPELAKELIRAAKAGAPSLPISVKTRVGYNNREIETWIPALLEEGISALTIHARTRKEMSKVPANWDDVKRVVEIRNDMKVETLIMGNGDVKDLNDARQKSGDTGADGVMLGRAIFGNPFLLSNSHELDNRSAPLVFRKYLEVMVEHTKLFEELFKGVKSFAVMKKHYKSYVEGFPGAKELRAELMEAEDANEVEKIVSSWIAKS